MAGPLLRGGRVALLLLVPVGLLPFVVPGQRAVPHVRSPRFTDWTTRHVVYPQFGTTQTLEAARRDPRALFRWREVEQRELAQRQINQFELRSLLQFRFRGGPGRFPVRAAADIHADWNVSLGGGTTAPAQFPAKLTFDTTAAPSCGNDFVVFPVNVAGSATQPNIVAFNNLYSGTAGGTGICDGRATLGGHTDTKTSPTVLWSYNVHAIAAGAPVPGSPVLSLDGTKVAFVESVAGSPAHFHVLAWKSGDGQTTSLQNVLVPKAITTFSATAPASGAATDLAFGTTPDTLSSPYIDYANDTAYVGNDAGVLFRFKNVFCTLASCGTSSPTLDTSWGTSGSVSVCAGKLTGSVQDPSGTVYVGCADGKVYGFTYAGTPLANPSIAVGNGSATGGVVDPPIVDGSNGFVYAVSGTGAAPNTTSAVLVQAQRFLNSPRVALIGGPGIHNLHAPTFNDPYFSSATSTSWLIYAAAYDATGANLIIYAPGFDASRNMATGTPANTLSSGTRVGEYSPLTEFKNGATDWLFLGLLIGPSNLGRSNITTFPAAAPTVPANGVIAATSTGITAMIVDNASASNQASSIYFCSTGNNVAMKLTQAGLQ